MTTENVSGDFRKDKMNYDLTKDITQYRQVNGMICVANPK